MQKLVTDGVRQRFSTLITSHRNELLKFCSMPKNMLFADLTKIGIILIHSHWTAILTSAAVIFLTGQSKGKEVGAPD